MQLNIIGGVTYTGTTIAQNATVFTPGVRSNYWNGYITALITLSAGSVTISQQCSPDNSNWFDPVDSNNSSLSSIVTAMSVNTAGRYVQFAPTLAQYSRLKIVELNVGSATLNMSIYPQEGT